MSKMGIFHPIVHVDGIFWGAHGNKSYGASVRLRVIEVNFSPVKFNKVPNRRFLPPNTAKVETIDLDESSEEDEYLSEDEDED